MAKDSAARADTFPKLLIRNAKTFGTRPAFRHKDFGIWQTWTWNEVLAEVRAYAVGLHRLGLQRGDTIAIVGSNRPKLYWSITAAQMLHAVPVPVYADAVADELAYVLAHADVKFAAVEDQEQVDKILSVSERLPKLERIVYDEPRGLRDYDHRRLTPIAEVIANGRGAIAADAAIGRCCIDAATDTVAFDKLDEKDEALAYLPLAWVGDHYLNYAQGMVAGFCMACPESGVTAAQDLREIGPTFYFAPPRVFEQMLTRVMIRMEDAAAIKRHLFHYFIGVARRYGEAILTGKPVPLHGRLLYALGRFMIYEPLKNVLGLSRVRTAYTAGEAVGPDLFSFYRSLGLNLKQLYGQTEAFLYVTAQPDGQIHSDTVGPAAPNVDIRVAENGEVQFKSPGMFVGYFKDTAKTAEALTADGYVKTGDAGFFDEATGHLKIIDRAKDVGRLNDGTLFAPKYLENKLKFFPNIREAVAYGDQRDFVAVMLNIDLAAVGNWAERNNITYGSYQEIAGHPQLTRTQKVRRGFIAERYAPLIKALYDGSTEAHIATEVTFEDGRKGAIEGHIRIREMQTDAPETRREAA